MEKLISIYDNRSRTEKINTLTCILLFREKENIFRIHMYTYRLHLDEILVERCRDPNKLGKQKFLTEFSSMTILNEIFLT